jgi:hypothetical protein
MFAQLADGSENMGIMALLLLTEFSACAERLPEGSRIAGHKRRYGVLFDGWEANHRSGSMPNDVQSPQSKEAQWPKTLGGCSSPRCLC